MFGFSQLSGYSSKRDRRAYHSGSGTRDGTLSILSFIKSNLDVTIGEQVPQRGGADSKAVG